MNIIELRNVNKTFAMGDEEIKAIDNVNFTVEKGEFVSAKGDGAKCQRGRSKMAEWKIV